MAIDSKKIAQVVLDCPALTLTGFNPTSVITALMCCRSIPGRCLSDEGFEKAWDNNFQALLYRDIKVLSERLPIEPYGTLELARKFQEYRVTRGLNMTHVIESISNPQRLQIDHTSTAPVDTHAEHTRLSFDKTSYVNSAMELLRSVLITNRGVLSQALRGNQKLDALTKSLWNQFDELLYVKYGTQPDDWTATTQDLVASYFKDIHTVVMDMSNVRTTLGNKTAMRELLLHGLGDDSTVDTITNQLANSEAFNGRS